MNKSLKYPEKKDCRPGLWVELNNGWIIGPIIETDLSDVGTYVPVGPYQVITRDKPNYKADSPRLVNRVGTLQELCRTNGVA